MSQHGNVFEGEIRSGVYGIRPCVIKFAEISEQNVREAKILSKLGSHTNVIAIVQSGTYSDILEDRFYIALDKCHEENLRQYLSNRKNAGIGFDLEQANDFAHQIIDGVAYIHDNKVVHLDLKPSNILFSLNLRLIKIADFGLSRELKSTFSKFHLEGQFETDGYRPIESFGGGWVSLRSDIFSLGAVLFYLLSNGEEVFGDDEHKYIYNVNNNVMDTTRLLVPNPKTTEHLFRLMLSNERCRRPTIWQVTEHPCWTGNEVECSFDYGCGEEIDDSGIQIFESKNQNCDDSDSEADRNRKLTEAFRQMEMKRRPVRKPFILIFNGSTVNLERLDPRNKTITQMHEYHEEMMESSFSSVAIGDHLYVLTKFKLMYRLKYCDAAATWERMIDLVEDHGDNPPAVVASGTILVAGGSGSTSTNSVSKYDPSLNKWEKLGHKQLDTNDSANVSARGFVYCIGGEIAGDFPTNRVERLDVVSQSWNEVAWMREARYDASAAECGGSLFVVGGTGNRYDDLKSVEKYDPDVDQWSIVKSMLFELSDGNFRCHLIDGEIYVVGDGDKDIQKYDVAKDEWHLVNITEEVGLDIEE